MIKITIKTGEERISFPLNKVTYFHGYNYSTKYEVLKTLRKHFNKINQSEYDYEMQQTTNVFVDNEELNLRIWEYFEIDTTFNLEEQFKLRSKSFMLQYFESTLTNIEYEEVVSTINILLNELNEVINEKITVGDIGISIDAKVTELSLKNILKLIELSIYKNECLASGYNLSYNEHILLQIKLVKRIAEINILKKYIVLLHLPHYDKEFINELLIQIPNNIYFIVINNHNYINAEREEVIYFGKSITSLYDEVELYNKIMLEHGVITTIEELDNVINDFLKNKDNEITKILKENL